MQLNKVMRDIMDAVDGAGNEFKRGFSGAFRKRGGKHRADAQRIRDWDKRNSTHEPKHRKEGKPTSHAKEYSILAEVTRGMDSLGHKPRHADPDYNAARDLGGAVGQGVRAIPGDVLGEVKGIPKKAGKQVIEELYEDAIGQDNPDKYGATGDGDSRFLAPASEAATLEALSNAEIAARFGLAPGALDGATVKVQEIPGSRFVSVEIER